MEWLRRLFQRKEEKSVEARLTEEQKIALLHKWEIWWDEQPEEITFFGVVLKKNKINGVPLYTAPFNAVLWGRC